MDSLLWIVPLSLVLVGLALWAFFWAVEAGQFEDLESPGWSVLEDDPPVQSPADSVATPPGLDDP
jgi:cbb3-type cytochrome oxidase maturation protein